MAVRWALAPQDDASWLPALSHGFVAWAIAAGIARMTAILSNSLVDKQKGFG